MPAVGLGTVAVAVRRLAYRCGGSSGLSARTVLDELASGATGFPFQSPDCAGDHLERGHLNSARPQQRQRGVRTAARRPVATRPPTPRKPRNGDSAAARAAAGSASISDQSHTHTPARPAMLEPLRACARIARSSLHLRDFWPPARPAVAGPADFFARARAAAPVRHWLRARPPFGLCPRPGAIATPKTWRLPLFDYLR